jgi:hypothetical protein
VIAASAAREAFEDRLGVVDAKTADLLVEVERADADVFAALLRQTIDDSAIRARTVSARRCRSAMFAVVFTIAFSSCSCNVLICKGA